MPFRIKPKSKPESAESWVYYLARLAPKIVSGEPAHTAIDETTFVTRDAAHKALQALPRKQQAHTSILVRPIDSE